MDMHELQQAWSGIEKSLSTQSRHLDRLERRDALNTVRSRLRWVSISQIVQLVLGLLIVLWAGSYWCAHLGQTHLVVYGAIIHLYGIGLLSVSVVQLVRLAGIDYNAPVLIVQHELQSLRKLRTMCERTLLFLGFIVWIPFAFIALRAIGLDVWLSSPATLWWNLGVSVIIGALVIWLSYRFNHKFEHDSAGAALRAAQAELDDFKE
ncbi:MAG: hypothetical protein IPF83_13810 [Rhodanobacteraceae bacterium]|nr:hypothetical protein [Rhodanobacteraceae bacterium]MBP9154966.1 hypothetical protein [Xanthomonadales bacterium]HQW82401.1 hypothetical protein [Pseudomonadota bacterium]